MKRYYWIMLLFLAAMSVQAAERDSVRHESFGQKLLKPFKWVARNWSDYDPRYSLPAFYDWAIQVQNTTTQEWLNMESPEGMNLKMNSRMSNRLGPYFGYNWLFYGWTIDLNTIGRPSSKGKNEFTLSINSNLVNIDVIRRRTGGDFVVGRLDFTTPETGTLSLFEKADQFDIGNYIKNSLTGININYFTNHRRYSNPAAFTNGAVQLRSVGSPILGLGYTHQRVENSVSDIFGQIAASFMSFSLPEDYDLEGEFDKLDRFYETDRESYYAEMEGLLDQGWSYLEEIPELSNLARTFVTNRIPVTTRIDDWHLQLGYAYNLVFSRRVLLGLSAVCSPGLKRVRADNVGSVSYGMADRLSRLLKKHENVDLAPDYFRYNYDHTRFNVNTFLRASLTLNFNRWRAGLNASFNNFYYKDGDMKVRNGYGSLTAYVGYCFGRKKEFRYDGEYRQDYIMAALTKRQIEEMRDTLPASNLGGDTDSLAGEGRTRHYHTDRFKLKIFGCDLVRGPEGRYGWFRVDDGFVSPGGDSERRLTPGMEIEIDRNGDFELQAGHNRSFRAGNWWKSKVDISQIPNGWYPEMLHYALGGKLVLYLRGRIFGTKKPVKMEIDNVYINHGRESQGFFQMGIGSFRSNAPYSIEGRVTLNDRLCRVFIEQKRRGRRTNMYISRIAAAQSDWMSRIDGRRPVSTISMPGTHDSGTASIQATPVLGAAQTQNFSVVDQLADGIRAFDLRLKSDLSYGHFFRTHDNLDSTMVAWDRFLDQHPSECIVMMVGCDGANKWDGETGRNFKRVIERYPHRFVENFDARTRLDDVRGKILVIRRQQNCPYGKLLKFQDNAVFDYDCFHVEDVYKQHKTWKKIELVEQNIREAYENEDPDKWYITFNSIAWSPRRHTPYSYAWGGKAKNIRKPMNKSLREFIELKDYTDFGIVFLDFYNDHGEQPQVVNSIIDSNFHIEE